MDNLQAFLDKLQRNLEILRKQEAEYQGNAPPDLLNQIHFYESAVNLTQKAHNEDLTEIEWQKALGPLLLNIEKYSDEASNSVTIGDIGGNIQETVVAGRDATVTIGQKISNFSLFRDVKQVLTFLFVTIGVAAIIIYWTWLSSQPEPMSGDFNIVVAQFGEVTDQGIISSAPATEISRQLFNFLDSEYKATDFGLDIQVTHNNIGILTEDREAEQLASDIGADVVIYGSIFTTKNSEARLSPRFFIIEREDSPISMVELIGQHQLALPILFDISSLGSQDKVGTELSSRAAILVSFTQGLVYLSANNLDAANRTFQRAIHEAEQMSLPFDGQEVLYLSAAETSRLQKKFDLAAEYLDKALSLNQEYARAYIAWGNVYYEQAVQGSFEKIKLDQAFAEYDKALRVKDQPDGAYITEKANLALGNVSVVQAQQNSDLKLFDQAIRYYKQVIARYEQTKNRRIKPLVAIAYFGLGAAYERLGNYAEAAQAYQQCMELTTDPQLKSRAEKQLSIIKG